MGNRSPAFLLDSEPLALLVPQAFLGCGARRVPLPECGAGHKHFTGRRPQLRAQEDISAGACWTQQPPASTCWPHSCVALLLYTQGMAVGGAGCASTAHPLCLQLLNARLGAPGPGTSCLGSRSSQHCKRVTAWPAELPACTGFMLTGQHPTPLLRPEYARWAPALPAHACPGSCQRMCTVPPSATGGSHLSSGPSGPLPHSLWRALLALPHRGTPGLLLPSFSLGFSSLGANIHLNSKDNLGTVPFPSLHPVPQGQLSALNKH